ncbi:MAG: disulfide bond formation protein B, partial [Candidatus Korarchaeota archaeon]|nr:disulfide bond formation protein B [Candidatus Korarchaeota archaeon]
MTPTFKVAILLCALVALLGISISLYTEFIAGIKPCFSCNLLRYSYFLILVISLLSLKFRSLTPVLLVISAFI